MDVKEIEGYKLEIENFLGLIESERKNSNY